MSGTFRRIGNTYETPYTPRSTAHDEELPVSPHQLRIPHGESWVVARPLQSSGRAGCPGGDRGPMEET